MRRSKIDAVMHITSSLGFGGVESHMKILALNSHISRYEHLFCAISGGGAVADELIAAQCPVKLLNVQSKIPSLTAVWALIWEIRAQRPSIVHCHGAEANFHGLIAGTLCQVPVCIAEEIGFPNHSKKARLIFRWTYRLADSVVAISQAVKRKIVDMGEIQTSRCHVLLNPTQMLEERNLPTLSDEFRVGFVGRLEEVKNPIGLVRAVSLLRDRGVSIVLRVVGDGSQRTILEQEVATLGLTEHVILGGFASEPFAQLLDADLYVQPSISEGFGLALVEAMSMGIPVLATAVGGAPEIICDGENGWLLSGTSPAEIADKIEKIAKAKKALLEAIGKKGRESVVNRFSPAVYIKECDAFYDRLLSEQHS